MKTPTDTLIIHQALSLDQLLVQLGATRIAIPPGHGRQQKKPIERWAACRLLGALGQGNRLFFPFTMRQNDRPDFSIEAGEVCIGLEATVAISQNYARCQVLRDKRFPDACIDMGLFRHGVPELTNSEMLAILASGKLSSPPYAGNSLERDWAAHMRSCIAGKIAKLSNSGFVRYKKNWLVIHDNLPMPSYSLDEGMELLMPLLEEYWSRESMFDEIFIEHTDTIVCITKNAAVGLPIPDLWGATSQDLVAVA